ncbi:MAG TPA: cytochrome C oxidase subunit IV family protein [Bacteroidia bacterium]|jgi:cytochrome c oxidase subunit 4|nr:cytochrome C oxidase subunit IV family protein [Bacteroidia bacterium]
MEFHDDYPEYEKMATHDEVAGKKLRRTLWNVFWIMLVITISELVVGFIAPGKGWTGSIYLKVFFISFTIAKAAYIVMVFMHLGHEVKFFKFTILLPYITFMLYCIFICLNEGTYSGKPANRTPIDALLVKQQVDLRAHKHHGGGEQENVAEPAAEHH